MKTGDSKEETDQARKGWLEEFLAGKDHPAPERGNSRAGALLAVIKALVNALEARDHYTSQHSAQVTVLAEKIAGTLALPPQELYNIAVAALLHDIGKIGMPDRLLYKSGPLTEEEWKMMKRHPDVGAAIIGDIPLLEPVAKIVRHHHERWDGKGYPAGLAGGDIPLGARIVAVADTFQAMVSDRPYRPRRSPQQAAQEISALAGSQFDPAVVKAFTDSFWGNNAFLPAIL